MRNLRSCPDLADAHHTGEYPAEAAGLSRRKHAGPRKKFLTCCFIIKSTEGGGDRKGGWREVAKDQVVTRQTKRARSRTPFSRSHLCLHDRSSKGLSATTISRSGMSLGFMDYQGQVGDIWEYALKT